MRDFGLLILRLTVGGIMAAHGYPKLFGGPGKPVPAMATEKLGAGYAEAWEHGGENWANMLQSMNVPAPQAVGVFSALVELVGGLCLALGWFTRPAALLLCGQMAVAIQKVHWKNGLVVSKGGYEFALALLSACAALLLGGPGRFSIDGDS